MSNCTHCFSGHTVILSLFLGAVAGAAVVLLLAPKTRRESTETIRKLSRDLQQRASDAIDTASERVSATVSGARDFLDEKRAVFTSAVEAGRKAYARSAE